MILSHITTRENFYKIITDQKIIPCKSVGFVRASSRDWNNIIFLTDNIEYIQQLQLTKKWIDRNKAVSMQLNMSGLIVKPYIVNVYTEEHRNIMKHEFTCDTEIDTDRILNIKYLK